MGNYASKNSIEWLVSAIKSRFAEKTHSHSLSDVLDVTASTDEINILDGATVTTAEVNYLDGVTSNIQDQISVLNDYNDTQDETFSSFYNEEYTPLEERVASNEESLADKASMHGVLTEGDGSAYTATVDGIDSLEIGVYFMMIPHTISTSTTPTLNVNGLGAKSLRCRISGTTSATVAATDTNWLAAKKPVMVTYDGLFWIVDHIRPNANNLYGVVQIEQGGTGASTAEEACDSLGAVKKTGDTMTGSLEIDTKNDSYLSSSNLLLRPNAWNYEEGGDVLVFERNLLMSVVDDSDDIIAELVVSNNKEITDDESGGFTSINGAYNREETLSLVSQNQQYSNTVSLSVNNDGEKAIEITGVLTAQEGSGVTKAIVDPAGKIAVYPEYEYDTEYDAYYLRKPDESFIGSVRTVISEENNARQVGFYTLSDNNYFAHELMIGVDDAGNRTVDVGLGDTAWREAIGANNASNITTGTLALARGGTGATTAAAARTNLGAAAKSWTSLGTVTSGNDMTLNLTNYSEILIMGYYSTTYLSSVVLPVSFLSTTEREVYLGGCWTSSYDRCASVTLSKTNIHGWSFVIDGSSKTGNYRVYAR